MTGEQPATVEVLRAGSGTPVTLFAHGLGGSIRDTRPLASGVPGTRVLLSFRGHGATPAGTGPWSYAELAEQLRAVADRVDATAAIGVSMGAGALLHLLAATPARFTRLVFFLPAALDRPHGNPARRRLALMASYAAVADPAALAALLRDDLPAEVRHSREALAWCAEQAEVLARPDVARALRELPAQAPVADRRRLAAVRAPALVVGHDHDPLHPASVAGELATALPAATLHVFPNGGGLWRHRRELRQLISGFLPPSAAIGPPPAR